jgi:hypothetical protein
MGRVFYQCAIDTFILRMGYFMITVINTFKVYFLIRAHIQMLFTKLLTNILAIFVSLIASSSDWTQTLNLGKMRRVFYHCAIDTFILRMGYLVTRVIAIFQIYFLEVRHNLKDVLPLAVTRNKMLVLLGKICFFITQIYIKRLKKF